MNTVEHKQRPESWDEATDIRRFWWMIFPIGIAVWVSGVTIFMDGGTSFFGLLDNTIRKTERSVQTMPAAPGDLIQLENIRGNVIIQSGEPGEVRVEVERSAEGISEAAVQRALAGYATQVQYTPGTIRIFMAGVSGEPRHAITTVTLHVPDGIRVQAQTLTGNIRVEVEGPIDVVAGTLTGNIDVRVPSRAALNTWVEAREVRPQMQLASSEQPGGRRLLRSLAAGDFVIDLDLRAPDGEIIIRPR